MQYAVSLNDRMPTYQVNPQQAERYIELAAGLINAEIERGKGRVSYVDTIYVNQKPVIFIFDKT